MSKGKGAGKPHQDGSQIVLKGGRGNDIYYIDQDRVTISEKVNGGHDTVHSYVDASLDPNVEDLVLMGDENLSGTGNALDNTITGNSGDNLLNGGLGADTLDGGSGYDTAQYSGESSEYIWIWTEDAWQVTDSDGVADILTNIEELMFDDGPVSLASDEEDPAPDGGADAPPDPTEQPSPTQVVADAANGHEDQSVTIEVLANDTGQGLVVVEVSHGSLGTVSINVDNSVTYVPDPNANGTDSFEYTVLDQFGQLTTGRVDIRIDPENDVPVAVVESYSVASDAVFESSESVLANDYDIDGDALTLASFDTVSENGGTVAMNADGTFTYIPPSGFSGDDRFSYVVSDQKGGEVQSWVGLAVEPPSAPDPMPEPDTSDPAYDVETLMAGDWYRLNANEDYGTGAVVTYAFADVAPDYYADGSAQKTSFLAFDETQQANTRAVLDHIESFSGLTFVETSLDEAEMVFGFADIGSSGFADYPTYDGVGKVASDVWLEDGLSTQTLDPGSEAYKTLLHEIGHAIGLKHPILPEEEDSRAFTVMSSGNHPTMGFEEPSTYMQYDIATLQYLYGANHTYRTDDDVYTADELSDVILTLWDAGGNDTLDLSTAAQGVDISLAEGTQSTVAATGSGNLTIALGTQIENAIGSTHDDRLTGSELDNALTGGAGMDVFVFGDAWGNDQVTDFTRGEDKIDLSRTGATFEDLQIDLLEGAALITWDEQSIRLLDQDDEDPIDEADFIFA